MAVTNAAPIISTRFDQADAHTLDGYLRTGGYAALRKALAITPDQVLDEVKAANLQGRGGAGFPAGAKWGFLPKDVFPRYFVVNGDESEPGTCKDRPLMEHDPHQLIEGLLISCYAVRAAQAFIYVRGEMALAQERLAIALNEAYAAGYIGRDILGSGWSLDIVLHWGAGAYIVGEETALIESLEGQRGMPRLKPPYFPAAKGLYLQPTVVNNVETLSNIPWIITHGGAAFAALGGEKAAGMRLFALSGHVRRPGVYEVEMAKTTFRDLVEAPVYGGGMRHGNALKAFIPGGASAPWFYPEQLDLALDAGAVGAAGSMLGSGAVVIMDETTCAVRAAWRLVRFFAHESCGKCTPCREGGAWLEKILRRILDGHGRDDDLDLLLDVGDNISPGPFPHPPGGGEDAVPFPFKQTTICPLGPSAVSPVYSSIWRFRDEYLVHIKEGAATMADTEQAEQQKTMVTVTLDGRTIEAEPGELLIAAAERHGTYIPRFCYHPRMREVGMCRMCIVEIDSGRGPALQPACMAPVAEGMKVDTQSALVKKAQDGVLEFLLINHPLDCPVCDKGGECPLQDQTLAFGPGESRFIEEKRHFEKPIPISELVYLDRERCILCDRCTRFAAEVAGDPLISFIDRGNHTQVNTFPDDPFASYFSGNTVQICPVGALLARPYRFRARPWDLDQVESTCTACSVGCRIALQSSSNRLVRKLGVDVDAVNWGWLCDKGRFDFEAVGSDDRLGTPLVRAPGADDLVEASWADALAAAAEGITRARTRRGPESIAVLGGARGTNEDAYAWSKLARTLLGTDSIDAQMGDGLPAEVVVGLPRATIDAACAADTILLLGPDLKEELPVLYLRLRQAVVERGATLVELSPVETGMTRYAAVSLRYRPGEVAALVAALVDESPLAGEGDRPGGLAPAGAVREAGELLRRGSLVCVLGRPSLAESAQPVVEAAGALLAARPETTFLPVLRRGNVAGALDMGLAPGLLPGRVGLDEGRPWFARDWEALPSGRGLDAEGIITAAAEGRVGALVLVGADPLADFPDRELARRALAGAGFVLAVDCFLTDSSRRADVVLPAAAFGEKSGTTTNIEGRVSRLHQKVTAPGTARADWMIAAELAFHLGGDLGFDSVAGIWDEIERLAPAHRGLTSARLASPEGFDGIVAGTAHDVATHGGPPSMAQTDSPGIQGALAHTRVDTLASSAMGTAAKPDPTEGLATQSSNPSGGGAEGTATVAGRPAVLRWASPGASSGGPPPLDRYSLRLVASRRLYDAGTFVHHSPSLAPLAPGARLRVNPADLAPLGVGSGARLQVSSGRGRAVLEAVADPGVPQGSVALSWNQPGPGAADLIDAAQAVTEVRLETLSVPASTGARGTES